MKAEARGGSHRDITTIWITIVRTIAKLSPTISLASLAGFVKVLPNHLSKSGRTRTSAGFWFCIPARQELSV